VTGRRAAAVQALLAVLLGACCAVALACGASRDKSSPAAPSAAPASADTRVQDMRAEIEALDREIAAVQAGESLPAPAVASCAGASCAEAMSRPYTTPSTSDPACRPAASPACRDTCTLATAICKNQQRICELAAQLAGDDWAANKCETARASCTAAHDRCCSCVL
jgi:hypothetical protein